MSDAVFVLDEPGGDTLERVTRFSGWSVGIDAELELRLDGQPWAGLRGGQLRPDVLGARPDDPRALRSGFSGDLLLPEDASPGDGIVIEIAEHGVRRPLHRAHHVIGERLGTEQSGSIPRPALREILRCPETDQRLCFSNIEARAEQVERVHPVRAGVPYFLAPGEVLPCVRLSESGATNPYGEPVRAILDAHEGGCVLDFGSGNPGADRRPDVVHFDVQHFPGTDVVCTTRRLPFADGVFDAIVSQAVFEHLADPFATAKELARVLKVGGQIYVETAFLQPLHGDPSHHFNMTAAALRNVMAPFDPVDEGIRPHQFPSCGLRMQLDEVLPEIVDPLWRGRLERARAWLDLEGEAFDEALGVRGRRVLAAGVYFLGRKG